MTASTVLTGLVRFLRSMTDQTDLPTGSQRAHGHVSVAANAAAATVRIAVVRFRAHRVTRQAARSRPVMLAMAFTALAWRADTRRIGVTFGAAKRFVAPVVEGKLPH